MSALTDAWQTALAAEHRAAFAYGLVGAQLHGTADIALVIACSDEHEGLRNLTEAAMTSSRLEPVPPSADYPDLYPVATAAQARAVALRVERDCASAWRFLYAIAAATTGRLATQLRASAQSALTASAVRAAKWGLLVRPSAPTTAFPGMP